MTDPQQQQASRDDSEVPADVAPTGVTRPADSPITIDRFPDGLTIQVPPAGLWRGSKGLFAFALIWNGFMLLFSPCLLGAVLGAAAKPQEIWWVVPLLLSIFWLVGVGILLAAVNMGRRRAVLAFTGGRLMVIQTGLFGSKQRDWALEDLEDIRVGPSGMTVNDQPVLQLQIDDGGDQTFGLLTGRSDAELEWLAWELGQALPDRGAQSR